MIYKDFKNLSEEQKNAVLCDDDNILVTAGPGSGKTVVIINRVYHLINNKRINPKNIIVITFTKAAANNMKVRYIAMSNNTLVPFFGTFHGLFYKILTSYYGKIQIIESNETFKLVKSFLITYMEEVSEDRIKEFINGISVFKSSSLSLEEFKTDLDKDIFKNCYEIYERYKKERNLVDFEDLQIMCKNLFIKNTRLLESYRNLFRHILVDEFQDCDALQLDILKLLKGDNNVFAVGDEDQCIYSFRGSRPDFMVNFNNIFNNGKKLYLTTNYRSVVNIVDLSMSSIKNNKLRSEKIIVANKKSQGNIALSKCQTENLQGDFIANDIDKMVGSTDKNYKAFAILYRTNIESRSIIDGLIRKKIPFKLLDKEFNFYDHFICKDLLAYLKLSIDNWDIDSFTRIINKPYRYISKINLEAIKKNLECIDCFEKLKAIDSIPIFQLKVLDKLKKDIQNLNKMSLHGAISFIIQDLGYHDYLVEYCNKYKIHISDLENIIEEFKDSLQEYKTIINFLAHVEVVNEELIKSKNKSKDEDVVLLSTIHGVKGMEFSDVYIINLVEGIIPHEHNLDINLEEERRLFYVAVTRAINNLNLMLPSVVQGKTRKPSRFLNECNFLQENINNTDIVKGSNIIHKSYGTGIVKDIEEGTIAITFKNGLERRFDFKVLVDNNLMEKID
ncbi:ATP-dependent helicase [Clostridium sp.]|uniref:ATP-dependent helicase n=1 Tax=Clostridium sp. TaxID=1506 RepID=UPI002FC93641